MSRINEIIDAIENKDIELIKDIMKEENLKIENGKIVAKDYDEINDKQKLWDQTQLVRKIQLNSVYGAVTNKGSNHFDHRLGQSCTLSGRSITRHMGSYINQQLDDEYKLGRISCSGDTDSVLGDTVLKLKNRLNRTIEEIFLEGSNFYFDNGKEYVTIDDKCLTYDPDTQEPYYENIDFVYRHKVNKKKWEVEDEDGNVLTITSDHSIMVERDGILIECKPCDIKEEDLLITIK